MALTLDLRRVVPGETTRVYRYFSESQLVAQWFGPRDFGPPTVDFHPRVGDSYRIEMHPPEGEPFYLNGTFREVDPLERLAFTFRWDPPDADDVETLAQLSFRDFGDLTEVVLRQGEFKTADRLELHRAGWNESFDKLERLAASHGGA